MYSGRMVCRTNVKWELRMGLMRIVRGPVDRLNAESEYLWVASEFEMAGRQAGLAKIWSRVDLQPKFGYLGADFSLPIGICA